jgi:asparagine synthetase B (glutamine-hydrolysing)
MNARPLPVPAFAWGAGGPLGAREVAAAADPPALLREAEGQFALHLEEDGRHVLARDRLGVHKLFLALAPDGDVRSSSYAVDLVRAGHPLRAIHSVPAGHVLEVEPRTRTWRLERSQELRFGAEEALDEAAFLGHARRIRGRLDETFGKLARLLRGHRVLVALSGGLDSTTIAALARRHLGDVTAVTIAVEGPGLPASEDMAAAAGVAEALALRFEPVMRPREAILELVDEALVAGQDWREFNVHCALVNAALARAIRGDMRQPSAPIAVLTGDAMNELLADYAPVVYRGREHYALPRLPPASLRRFLVAGLDAGDREVGVYARHGIAAIQPFAWCADAYAALPAGFFAREGWKSRLVRAVMGDEVPASVLARPKVRAQAGGAEVGGTLAVLADEGLDEAWLARRFRELLGADEAEQRGFVRAGIYRFTSTYPG